MSDRKPIEVFPPGEFIREELEARGWTQEVLADILGRPARLVSEIVNGKRAISPETARGLGDAFGTGAQVWMNLETAYQLSRVQERDDAVARRARLYDVAPVREMLRRNWLEHSNSVDVLERRILDFFEVDNLDETPRPFPHAARKSTSYATVTPSQTAWLFRCKKLAKSVSARPYSDGRFRKGLQQLRMLLHSAEEIRHVPRVLADAGVRFLVVEHLPRTRIDGCAFWLDARSPVVVLSLRYDRIDYFWHTLIHDLGHVLHKDGRRDGSGEVIDTDLVGEGAIPIAERPKVEQRVDREATEFLVSQAELDDFIGRVRPLYSKKRIGAFAQRIRVHPGIVVGQLQYRDEVSFAHSRDMLVRVRHIVTESALTDGWGHTLPSEL